MPRRIIGDRVCVRYLLRAHFIGRRIRYPAYAKDAPVACFHMILGSHSQEKNLWARAAAIRQEKTALSFAILWLAAAADQIQVR
ncbi:hypothetical protein [Teichococcus vastitatis]|uniref:hypothetical protein n=1 Tax=Teichococcus vastitatis TaxID=2307076 RepID=UPI0013002493|nr:hypothetical protein [Pseudoroseomonas vastitatis]